MKLAFRYLASYLLGNGTSGQVKRITTKGLGRPTAPVSLTLEGCIQLERYTYEPVPTGQCDLRTAAVRWHLIQAVKEESYSDRW